MAAQKFPGVTQPTFGLPDLIVTRSDLLRFLGRISHSLFGGHIGDSLGHVHATSIDKMTAFRHRYLDPQATKPLVIVDLGSQDIRGSYRPMFDVLCGDTWASTACRLPPKRGSSHYRTNSQRLFNEGGTFDLATFNVASCDSASRPEKARRNRTLAAPNPGLRSSKGFEIGNGGFTLATPVHH